MTVFVHCDLHLMLGYYWAVCQIKLQMQILRCSQWCIEELQHHFSNLSLNLKTKTKKPTKTNRSTR